MIQVRLQTKTLIVSDVSDVSDAFVALRTACGAHDVCLLESPAGPARDRARALVGVHPLLTLEVRRGSIAVGGRPAVAGPIRDLSGAGFPVHIQAGGPQAVEDDKEGLDSQVRLRDRLPYRLVELAPTMRGARTMPVPRSVEPREGITS